jgi:predicted ABC-type ATPase
VSSATALAPIREALGRAQPILIFLAGPNGSGKSTFFNEYLGDLGLPYVNPDLFATRRREAAPDASSEEVERRAFAEAEEMRDALLEAGISFCTETVFSDPYRAKVGFLERARASGYAVFLVFIGLDSVDLSVARVSHRVASGGHDVPDEKLRARFPRTLANLRAAIPVADEVFLLDNSSFQQPYRLIAVYSQGQLVSQNPPLPPWMHGLPGS